MIAPVFIFAGRRPRLIAAALFVILQVVILLTGNYTFFNALTILLCVPLLDDEALTFRRRLAAPPRAPNHRRWPALITLPLALVIVLATSVPLLNTIGIASDWSRLATGLYVWLRPLGSLNGYGLFAVMTRTRPEIILEGSDDGRDWREYRFRYKPGDLNQPPRFVAPFQPRLDWQMWFAALGNVERNPWVLGLEYRLLQNSPPVTALFAENPFPQKPPRFIRANSTNTTSRIRLPAARPAPGGPANTSAPTSLRSPCKTSRGRRNNRPRFDLV